MSNWVSDLLTRRPDLAALPITRRARHAIHFRRPSGIVEAHFVSAPCHYESAPGRGDWAPIDTDLRDVGGGVLAGLGTPALIGADGSVGIRGTGYSQRPARIVRYRPSTAAVQAMATIPATGAMSGDSYVRSWTGVVYTVTLTESGVRQTAVLDRLPSLPGNTQPTDYVTIEEELVGQSLPSGEVLGEFEAVGVRFPAPTAWDASGSQATTRRWAKVTSGRQYLYTGVPVSWLQAASYPVTIDPDFAGDSADGYVQGSSTDYATARSTSTTFNSVATGMRVGQAKVSTTFTAYRAYLAFVTSSIGAGNVVTQANLKLTATGDQSATDFNVNIAGCTWVGSWAVAANRESDYDAALAATLDQVWRSTSGMATNTQYTSPNLATNWITITGTTRYALLSSLDVAATENSGQAYVEIGSQDNTTEGYRPVLTVLYEAAPATGRSWAVIIG